MFLGSPGSPSPGLLEQVSVVTLPAKSALGNMGCSARLLSLQMEMPAWDLPQLLESNSD